MISRQMEDRLYKIARGKTALGIGIGGREHVVVCQRNYADVIMSRMKQPKETVRFDTHYIPGWMVPWSSELYAGDIC